MWPSVNGFWYGVFGADFAAVFGAAFVDGFAFVGRGVPELLPAAFPVAVPVLNYTRSHLSSSLPPCLISLSQSAFQCTAPSAQSWYPISPFLDSIISAQS